MASYNLYFFQGPEITGLVAFEATNDTEAQAEARWRADGRAMELWREGHRIAVYPADPRTASAGPGRAATA